MRWQIRVKLELGALDLDVDIAGDTTPVALVGPNGSGKTTLMRTIAGAHRPAAGRIEVGGQLLFDAERRVHLPPEARRVGYVPQGYGLFPHLTVVDNVAFGARAAAGRSRDERRADARTLLDQLDCVHLADRRPGALSGGEQQRVALARALMIDPQILLLDEPLAALDAAARRTLRAYLADRLASTPAPAIVVTHDARDVRALGATVFVLEEGKITQQGTVEALVARPATAFVAEFFDVGGVEILRV